MNLTSRQRALYLVSKLYELAAEFTDSELREMAEDTSNKAHSSAIQNAINALIELHRLEEVSEQSTRLNHQSNARGPESAEVSSLAELLSDRVAFPTVADIARTIAIEAKPKEARDRYVGRVSRVVGAMDPRDRTVFLKRIAENMNKRPESFISNWSKLIKEM